MKQIKRLLTLFLLTLSTLFTYSQYDTTTYYVLETYDSGNIIQTDTLFSIDQYSEDGLNYSYNIIINDSLKTQFPLDNITSDSIQSKLNSLDSNIYANNPNSSAGFPNGINAKPGFFISVYTDKDVYIRTDSLEISHTTENIYGYNFNITATSQTPALNILVKKDHVDTTSIYNFYTNDSIYTYEKRSGIIVDVTSIDETQSTSFNVFPNPTSDYINITGLNTNQTINILDINGRLVKTINNYSSEQSINVAELTPGFYFLKVDNKTYRFIKK